MNARKRQASDTILPLRAAKVPRTTRTHHPGRDATPIQDPGLVTLWYNFAYVGMDLVRETWRRFWGQEKADSERPEESQNPSTTPPPAVRPIKPSPRRKNNLPSSHHHSPPPPAPTHAPAQTAPPRTARQHQFPPLLPPAPPLTQQKENRSEVQTGLPSPPATHSTLSSSTSSASFIGLHPDLDAVFEAKERSKNGIVKKRKDRVHIYAKKHKEEVRAKVEQEKEEMEEELYQIKRASGYNSSRSDFKGFLRYQERLEKETKDALSPSRSLSDLRRPVESDVRLQHRRNSTGGQEFLRRALEKARATLHSPKPPRPFSTSLENLRILRLTEDEKIERRLRPKQSPLPDNLPPDDDAEVDQLLLKRGMTWKCNREQVTDQDLTRLLPGQWLNDEIMNFYGQMIQLRSEESKENSGGKPRENGEKKKPLNVHYFNTFFWSKLRTNGYEKGRLAKWTKTVDLFSKDIVLFPINHNNAHWTAAAINFRQKRIESYDSMAMERPIVYKILRDYLDAEHRNKKKKPFDFTDWEDYDYENIPQQENGYDCGVFVCQFLESLSRGEETFVFTQKNMPYFRRRMVWEICHGHLRDNP